MIRLETAAYFALLRLLPADVRRDFGADMAQMFRDRRRTIAGRPLAVLRWWLASLGDLIIESVRSRRSSNASGASLPPPHGHWRSPFGSLGQDVRVGWRGLRRDASFTVVAVLVLAIGIGANSAAFSMVNALLLKPRPGHPAGVVVGLYDKDPSKPDTFRAFSWPEFLSLRAHRDAFAGVTAHNFAFVGIDAGGHTRQVIVDMVSREFFDVFGSPLARGRGFTADEERPGVDPGVAILSYAAWQSRGGGEDVLGSTVRLNGRPLTIVGVAQKGFGGSLALVSPELFVPISAYDRLANDFVREGTTTTLADRRTRMLIVDVQLQPGATIAAAAPQLQAMTAELLAGDPSLKHAELMLAPLARLGVSTKPRTDSDLTAVTAALLSLSGLVLLIASLNLANMLLARGIARRKEFAIRLAIGGTRARIVRQLLVEGAMLALMGGVLGLVLAQWSTWALVTKLSPYMPISFTFDSSPDARVVTATLGFAMVSVLLFSLGPAWSLARTQALPELKTRAGELAGRSRLAARHVLVGGQLALSLIMLTAAGLFVESAINSAHRNPGVSMDRGIVAQVDASLAGHNPADTTAIYERLLDQLRARADVAAVGLASNFPMSGLSDQRDFRRAGAPRDPAHVHAAELVSVSPAYFDALGLRLIGGRAFGADAMRTTSNDAVVDVPLARQLFGDSNPLGQTIEYDPIGPAEPARSLTVVGLVPGIGDSDGNGAGTSPHVFLPYGLDPRASVYVLIQTHAPTANAEAAMLPALQRAFKTAAPDLPALSFETRPMYRDRGVILALVRTAARIFGAFGLAALLLAAIGVYGVKAYVVSRRTREIGIRLALGATRPSVLWLVTREGLVVASLSLAVGVGLSIPAGIGLQSMLSDDLASLPIALGAVGVLLVALLSAGLIPARRAMRIQPTTALRTE